jgi:hypothetical protein
MGVGANTGPVVLGTVGARERIQCSVIGDTVNLASRIEQLTKIYRARFLIGEHTFASMTEPQAFEFRRVDRVAVRGRNVAVDLYEVMDAEAPDRRAAKLATRAVLQTAMEGYFRRAFEAALSLFEQVRRADPDDALPPLFIERCTRYLGEPPPRDWQGFERLSQK